MKRILVTLAILLAWGGAASAQHDDERYVPETDLLVLANPKANIAKEVFDAFRAEDFLVGAYFSKPDWHTSV
jgi:hypothetical protein